MIGRKTTMIDHGEVDARAFAKAGVGRSSRDYNLVLLVSIAKQTSKVRRVQVEGLALKMPTDGPE